jgi:hypothetical protein
MRRIEEDLYSQRRVNVQFVSFLFQTSFISKHRTLAPTLTVESGVPFFFLFLVAAQ